MTNVYIRIVSVLKKIWYNKNIQHKNGTKFFFLQLSNVNMEVWWKCLLTLKWLSKYFLIPFVLFYVVSPYTFRKQKIWNVRKENNIAKYCWYVPKGDDIWRSLCNCHEFPTTATNPGNLNSKFTTLTAGPFPQPVYIFEFCFSKIYFKDVVRVLLGWWKGVRVMLEC